MEFTIVNGIGLWNSWTRNFKTPLLACLDLLDNSFDATLKDGNSETISSSTESNARSNNANGNGINGKIHLIKLQNSMTITPNQVTSTITIKETETNDENKIDEISLSNSPKKTSSTSDTSATLLPEKKSSTASSGIRILNNSSKPIKPLVEILEVYRSEKGGKHTKSVGENGVGLKQGCATLSDLSFVITKNHPLRRLELGIIAANLQRESGVRLPAFQFHYKDETKEDLLKDEMKRVTQKDEEVQECIQQFGKGSFDDGLNELSHHLIDLLSHDEWGDHAFCVILNDLRHGEASKLLDEIREEIPRYYIHVPSNFEFRVDSIPIQFSYWQKRLVELSSFQVRIDPQNAWDKYEKKEERLWKNPSFGYVLNIYCGFDPIRDEKTHSHPCSLYVYSRRFGRLIKHVQDARAYLGLISGGSDFSQGMTVIVDDIYGNLPLSPSKQDIAFGEEEYGSAHKLNVLSFTSGCAHLYWTHHAEKVDHSKTDLTFQVNKLRNEVLERTKSISKGDRLLLPLSKLSITAFRDIKWTRSVSQGFKRIRTNHRVTNPYILIPGKDTEFLIHRVSTPRSKTKRQEAQRKKANQKQKTGKLASSKRKHQSQEEEDIDFKDDDIIFLSNDVQEWVKKAKTKKRSSPHHRSKTESPSSHSFSDPQSPFTPQRHKEDLQKRKEFLKKEIEREKRENILEQQALQEVYDKNTKEITVLENRVTTMEKMMKAMVDAVS